MDIVVESLPAHGQPEQLILLLHGPGQTGADMAPLLQALRAEFPQAALLAPDAPEPADAGGPGRQWFARQAAPGVPGTAAATLAERVALALPPLLQWLRQQQGRLRVPPLATAIAGFSQGAILALQTALHDDGLAGRVLAFSGRFVAMPQAAPQHTTVHLFHGGVDLVIPANHARMALEVLGVLHGDATLDIAEGVGHELHPALISRALFRLRNHIPARTWAAALGAVPVLRPVQDHDA